jgi:arylsulfatase A-like enzyme
LWEGGHRVPAIAYWPGRIKPGSSSGETILTMDMFPTFAAIAQAALPDSRQLDGVDISPVLFENKTLPSRTLYWQYGDLQAVRQGKWKWIREGAADPQLFNLENDLAEQNDVTQNNPGIAGNLEALYNTWYAEVSPVS